MNRQPNDTAFPAADDDTHGLTIREYFAGQALVGMFWGAAMGVNPDIAAQVAADCFAIADAMIAEARKGA